MLLEVDAGRVLDLRVTGPDDGVPFLFHHGTPGAWVQPGAVTAAAHARGLRVVTYSRPGYGSSTRHEGRSVSDVARDSEAVLDHLHAPRAVVAGWSGGGPHALATGALLPDRVAGVLTMGGIAPFDAAGLDWMAGMGADNVDEFRCVLRGAGPLRTFLDEQREGLLDVDIAGLLKSLGTLLPRVDRAMLSDTFGAEVQASFREALRTGTDGWLDDDLAFVRPWGFDLDDLHRGGVPVFVWQGGEDLMVPPTHGAWLAQHLPGATPHLEQGHGHLSVIVGSAERMVDELAGCL